MWFHFCKFHYLTTVVWPAKVPSIRKFEDEITICKCGKFKVYAWSGSGCFTITGKLAKGFLKEYGFASSKIIQLIYRQIPLDEILKVVK